MPYTLGKKDCPHCKGEGVVPGATVTRMGFDGKERQFPTVYRCSCLELKPDEKPSDVQEAPTKPDAAQRAAGEKGEE